MRTHVKKIRSYKPPYIFAIIGGGGGSMETSFHGGPGSATARNAQRVAKSYSRG